MTGNARRDDLHYYLHDGSDALRFQLAGKLSEDAAGDLEQAWRTASSVIGERRVIFDLSGLTDIDASGQELLNKWKRQGALLAAISHQATYQRSCKGEDDRSQLARPSAEAAAGRCLPSLPVPR